MSNELDDAMFEAWKKIEARVLGDPIELRRRLDRRAKMFDHVPRALCLAIRASDRRITKKNACISPGRAIEKGGEAEHEVLLVARTVSDLCRPVGLYWGKEFGELAGELGADGGVPRRLERRGVLRGYRVALLGGRRGPPIPLVDSPVPATAPKDAQKWEDYGCAKVLDPGAFMNRAPDGLLAPYWGQLFGRMPTWFEQRVRRRPVFRVMGGRYRFMRWTWVCPECEHSANTIYFPLGAPDFVSMHDIKLPKGDWYDAPEQRLCFGCRYCQHVFGVARTAKSLTAGWSGLIAHMSNGLLFGREVRRPASFGAVGGNRRPMAARGSPRRDELEAYLAHTELSNEEIARRMGWGYRSVMCELGVICKKRGIKGGRAGLKRWWARRAAGEGSGLRAA